jgi:hypothetical protein
MKRTLSVAVLALIAMTGLPGKAHAQPFCREYTKRVVIDGRWETAYGTACLQPDGSWQEMNSSPARYQYQPEPPRPVYREVVYIERSPQPVYSSRVVHHHYPSYVFIPPGHYKHHKHHDDHHHHHDHDWDD